MSFGGLLIQTGTVTRYTSTSTDEAGQPVKTWATLHANEPCRVMSVSGREITVDKQVVVVNLEIFCGDIDVIERDRWTIDAVVYEILLVKTFQDSSAIHHKQCSVQVVR